MLNTLQNGGDGVEDKFLQQMKKGVLELLVLQTVCTKPAYGYELLTHLKECSDGLFALKEGTLYPILYRLEDDGLIESSWTAGEGRAAPKKVYASTEKGREECERRKALWGSFAATVDTILKGETEHEV